MNTAKKDATSWTSSTPKNRARVQAWSLAWVVSIAMATGGPRFVWDYATVPTIIAVILSLVFGFGMIFATRRYLQGMDEMQQRIFRDAAVLTLGIGLVCGLSYDLLEDIRLISFQPEISHMVILMCLTFLAGLVRGNRKYQ